MLSGRIVPVLVALLLAVAVCVLAGSPLAGLVEGLWNGPGEGPPFELLHLLRAFGITLALALCVTALATVAGGALGFALTMAPLYGAMPLAILASLGILLPPYVYGMAWIEMTGRQGALVQTAMAMRVSPGDMPGPYSFSGTMLILACRFFPIAMWAVWGALRHGGQGTWEAAMVSGGPSARLRHVFFPAARPALVASGLIVVLLALLSQTIPTLFQTPVYTTQVLTRFSAFYDLRGGLVLALPLMVFGAGAMGAALALATRTPTENAHPARPIPTSSSIGWRAAWTVACWIPVVVAAGLPIATLAYRALPLNSVGAAVATASSEIGHSFLLASVSATVITATGMLAAWSGPPWRRAMTYAAPLPYLMGGPALGMALIGFWNHPGWRGHVYDSAAILVIAQSARYLFIGVLGAVVLRARFPQHQLDAARAAGASHLRALLTIAMPQVRWALLGLWLFAFAFAFGEAEASAMVSPPGATTLGVRLMALIHYGPGPVVAALCLLTVATIAAAAAAAIVALRVSTGGSRAA